MSAVKITPSAAAHQAYRLGVFAVVIAGLAVIGLLFWTGTLDAVTTVYALVVVFPMYVVVGASIVSAWAGLDKDATDLRPVTREQPK